MMTVSTVLLISYFVAAFSQRSKILESKLNVALSSPHYHIFEKWSMTSWIDRRIEVVGGSDQAILKATPTIVSSPDDAITVQWYNMSYQSNMDWIGLFNATDNLEELTQPPIKYKYLCNANSNDTNCPNESGNITFKLLNRRTNYVFAYVTQNGPYREVKAITDIVTYQNLYEPMHVHIASINKEATSSDSGLNMQIMWVQKETNYPKISYGTSKNNLDQVINIDKDGIFTYSYDDMCDGQYGQPAGTQGFLEPGYFIYGIISNLQPNTKYYYQVSDDIYGTSEIYFFTAPPLLGTLSPMYQNMKFVAFGDMGQAPIDGSYHHSWDFNNEGEYPSINTCDEIAQNFIDGPLDESDFLLHTGDISYAVGFLAEWDTFMHQIAPIASKIPYFTGIGNHEFSNTQEWKPPANLVDPDAYGNADSGGECGVPYNAYFNFASQKQSNNDLSQNTRKPWYTVDYSILRIVVVSSEHDYSVGSEQWNWVNDTLVNTDRNIFPWIIFTCHRPLYVNSGWEGDLETATYMQQQFEDILYKNYVSVGLYGHFHAYGRSCPTYQSECVSNGITQVVMGMAGYELTSDSNNPQPPVKPWVNVNNVDYGFLHFTVFNQTTLYMKFVSSMNGSIIDDVYIQNTLYQ